MPTVEDSLSQGWQLQRTGKPRQAEALYREALTLKPENASAWCYLGMALHDQQRYDEALSAYHRAIELQPQFPIAFNNLGNTYRLMRRLDEAVVAFDKALAQKPDYLIAFKNKATSLCWEARVADALAVYEQAAKFAPDDPDIHKHLGIMSLLLGDYARGWPEYEWRWKTGEIKLPELSLPKWDGSSLDGKSILLTPEQGLGDTIQFIRYAAWLKQNYDCHVVFQCPRVLRDLLSHCPGIDQWVDGLEDLPPLDCFAPLLHIPSVLGHTPREFPSDIPYLQADESLVAQWRQKLTGYSGRKIGIVWRGSPSHQADVMRSIPLSEFAPLMRLKGVQFFSLQKQPAADDLNLLNGRLNVVDLGSQIDETTGAFVETAAVLKNLDLLIACDTSVAHVAGALGVPVWLALCNVPDWRWLAIGDFTPWYPSMRLFRQPRLSDWRSVTEEIGRALVQEFPDVQPKQPADYCLATSGPHRLNQTRAGLVLYDRHDQHVGRSLALYGEYSASESDLFRQLVRRDWNVVEVRAGSGVQTMLLSRLVGPRGSVHAFEPERLQFQRLCANLALNGLSNVFCQPGALDEKTGTIEIQTPGSSQPLGSGEAHFEERSSDRVAVATLDSLNLSSFQFLKIDSGGRAASVVRGAAQSIQRLRPLIYVRAAPSEHIPPLIELLQSLDYQLYWHIAPLFDADNFYQNQTNDFGGSVFINILGLHSSVRTEIDGLKKIDGPHSDWRESRKR